MLYCLATKNHILFYLPRYHNCKPVKERTNYKIISLNIYNFYLDNYFIYI